jgi:hypothetical protein
MPPGDKPPRHTNDEAGQDSSPIAPRPGDKADRQRRIDGQLLATLYTAESDQLDRFRRLRLGRDSAISAEDLHLARDLLETLVAALREDDPEPWRRLREVFTAAAAPSGPGDEPTTQGLPRGMNERLRELGAVSPPSPWLRPWGQAYAADPVPDAGAPASPADDGYPPPPPPPLSRGSAPYPPSSSRAESPARTSDATQLMPLEDLDDGLTHDGRDRYRHLDERYRPEGYEPPPPPSEPTRPRRGSDPWSIPKASRVPDSFTPARRFAGDEDSATNQLSFISQAHGFALSVEEYAALCAERDHAPHEVPAIVRRFDVPEDAALATVDRAFELRFDREPALRSRWQRAYDDFAAALRDRS